MIDLYRIADRYTIWRARAPLEAVEFFAHTLGETPQQHHATVEMLLLINQLHMAGELGAIDALIAHVPFGKPKALGATPLRAIGVLGSIMAMCRCAELKHQLPSYEGATRRLARRLVALGLPKCDLPLVLGHEPPADPRWETPR